MYEEKKMSGRVFAITAILVMGSLRLGTTNPQQYCASFTEDGWLSSDPSKKICFTYFESNLTWWEANRTCHEKGMFLARPSTEVIHTFLDRKVPVTDYWIGAIYSKGNGWKWTNGDQMKYNDFQFLSFTGLFKNKLCALQTRFNWDKEDCNHLAGFLCQFQNNTSLRMLENGHTADPTSFSGTSEEICASLQDNVYRVNPLGNLCFAFVYEKVTWPDAKKWCEDREMFLAKANTRSIDSFLRYEIRQNVLSDFWIGGINKKDNGWKWANGEDMHYKNFFALDFNWDHISNIFYKTFLCTLYRGSIMGWIKKDCEHLAAFVCQINKTDPREITSVSDEVKEEKLPLTTVTSEELTTSKDSISPGTSTSVLKQEKGKRHRQETFQNKWKFIGMKLTLQGLARTTAASFSDCVRSCAADMNCVLLNFCVEASHCGLYEAYDFDNSVGMTAQKGCVVYKALSYNTDD